MSKNNNKTFFGNFFSIIKSITDNNSIISILKNIIYCHELSLSLFLKEPRKL